MNGNFKYTITDEQRTHMRTALTGKATKRMISRAEIADFLQGCLANMCVDSDALTGETVGDMHVEDTMPKFAGLRLKPDEEQTVESLRAEGKTDSYVRGWLQVGRRKGL